MKKRQVFQNFTRNNRWLGIIDYKSLIFLIIYMFMVWQISSIFSSSISNKLYVLIIFSIPVFLITAIYIKEESVLDMLIIVIKYIVRPKKYIYILNKKVEFELVKSTEEAKKIKKM